MVTTALRVRPYRSSRGCWTARPAAVTSTGRGQAKRSWHAEAFSISKNLRIGAHTPGFTGKVLERLRQSLPVRVTLCHDSHQRQFGDHVFREFAGVMGEGAGSVLIAPSDCGLVCALCRALSVGR
jgi:hypothetical protein